MIRLLQATEHPQTIIWRFWTNDDPIPLPQICITLLEYANHWGRTNKNHIQSGIIIITLSTTILVTEVLWLRLYINHTHKKHPKPHPYGRNIGCLLAVYCEEWVQNWQCYKAMCCNVINARHWEKIHHVVKAQQCMLGLVITFYNKKIILFICKHSPGI